MNDEIKNKIIAAAYGDASVADRLKIKRLIRKDPELKSLYDEYRETAKSVHKIKLNKCPDDLVQNAYEFVDDESDKLKSEHSRTWFGKPAVAAAVALVLLAAVIITFNLNRKIPVQNQNRYTQKEILEAEAQVKQSLSLVSKILNKTQEKLENEILPQKVGRPLKQGFEIINLLFPKGEKPDENS